MGDCHGNPPPPFIRILPTFTCLLLALLSIGTYPPFSLLLIDKLMNSKELKVAQVIVNQQFHLQNFVCGDILICFNLQDNVEKCQERLAQNCLTKHA